MSDIFSQVMHKISLCKPGDESARLAEAIAEVTGLSVASIAVAEKLAVSQRSFKPLRRLLENARIAKVNRLKYRIGLRQARKRSSRTGEVLANKIELTITTERGAIHCEADVNVVVRSGIAGDLRQTIHLEVRYSIYKGFKKKEFRQSLKLTARPTPQKSRWDPRWSIAA